MLASRVAVFAVLAGIVLPTATDSAAKNAIVESVSAPLHLGTLDRFYRAMQVQANILGQGLEDIPDYLLGDDIDLRYMRNTALSKEIPFVDSFTIMRLLGGYRVDWLKRSGVWDEALGNQSLDYVISNREGGELTFRRAIIERCLAPYLAAGYQLDDMTLAMVNTPWAIARIGGKEGMWGQQEPPANWDVWKRVVERAASDILYPKCVKIRIYNVVSFLK